MRASSEIGQIPPDWSVVPLGDVFELQQGKALSPSARIGASPRPFLRTANVLWGHLDVTVLDQMDFTPDEVAKLALRPGDLLVCEGGEIGRTAVWRGEVVGCLYQNHLHRLRTNTPKVVPPFVMYWLQAAFLHLGLYGGIGNKTTIPNLSGARLKQLPIPLPPIEEQRGVAHVLDTLQHAVRVQERTVASLRELKAATMAKLFREGLRREPPKDAPIGPVPRSWDVTTLGSLSTAMSYGTSTRCSEAPHGHPVLRIPNVVHGRIQAIDLKYAALPDGEALKLRLLPGDLLFVRTNGNKDYIGRCAVYNGDPAGALFASYLIRVRLDQGALLPAFAQGYLASLGRDQLRTGANSASDGKFNIDTGTLKGLLVPVPARTEQQQIIDIIRAVDRQLVAAERAVCRRADLFSSMLHLLMTGQVRVPAEAIEGWRQVHRKGKASPEVIDEIVRRIVEAVAPEKIILFGSAARGEMGPDSDLDLLVVKRCDDRREVARTVRACLRGVIPGRGKDVVVVTPEDVERDRDTIGYIIRPALREGRVLYAA